MNAALYALSAEQISSYLQLSGWQLVNQNDRCFVFEGYKDVDDSPFEIVLPVNERAPDYPIYVEHTVRILSALTEKSPATIVNEILLFEHDVIYVRVAGCESSISVDSAAIQVPRLKTLVAHSANSERYSKPYFERLSKDAKKMVEHFEFNCTVNGQVGYTIKSPVGKSKQFVSSSPQQLDLPINLPEKLPLQRRVVERIATGLFFAEDAVRLQNAQPLVEGYADGFNANMCDAVLKLSTQQAVPIQYRVKLSKKIAASEGMGKLRQFNIERRHHDLLKEASDKLKEYKQAFENIKGRVIGLSSLGDPLSDDVDSRWIVVQWDHRKARPRKLLINLGKHDYLKAHKAHVDWKTISVDGIVIKRRSGLQLADPQEFKILR